MVVLFHDMMHKEIEVYVDDMIAKSKTEEEHLVNLRKLFKWLRKYRLRLNLAKCTFGVKSGKLLCLIIRQKGIEVDPDKVKAILEMPEPPVSLSSSYYIRTSLSNGTMTAKWRSEGLSSAL